MLGLPPGLGLPWAAAAAAAASQGKGGPGGPPLHALLSHYVLAANFPNHGGLAGFVPPGMLSSLQQGPPPTQSPPPVTQTSHTTGSEPVSDEDTKSNDETRKNSIDALRMRAKEHQALLEQRFLAAAKSVQAQVTKS
jgi:hypothetical protein